MELPDGRFDEYAVNIIIENLIDQVHYQGWDTIILEEILSFRNDPDVASPTGEQAYTNVNAIQHPVITKKGWYVKFKWRY